MLIGKEKIKIDKMWNEEKLERVLFEIEKINYKNAEKAKNDRKIKRITTEVPDERNNLMSSMNKSSSNSRIPSGRKQEY